MKVSAERYTLELPENGVAILYEADPSGTDRQLPGGVGYLEALVAFARENARLHALIQTRHPTGSEKFAAALEDLAAPAPWRLCDEEIGEILAANGEIVCTVNTDALLDEDGTELAMWIILAVNTLAGFKAEIP